MPDLLEPARLRARLATLVPQRAQDAARAAIVRAPGRVNLIGEHTDYNDGHVLPVAIGLETRIAFLPASNGTVTLRLDATGEVRRFDLASPPPRSGDWIDYIVGVAGELHRRGVPLHGIDGVVASTIPLSAGLSSSAALEIAAAWAVAATWPPLPPMELARAAQRAENDFVGVRCGLMDQFASAFGRPGAALLLDCRSGEHRPVPLPLAEHCLVVCDSGMPRALAEVEYNRRRDECERATRILARADPAIGALRDATPQLVERSAAALGALLTRRARHVVSEERRVLDAVAALDAGDLARVGELMAQSHRSLRDDYEVSSPQLDALVEIAAAVPGVVGTRMTGAGFGGCTVTLVRRDAVDDLRAAIERRYRPRTGLEPRLLVVEPVAGAGAVA